MIFFVNGKFSFHQVIEIKLILNLNYKYKLPIIQMFLKLK